MCALGIRGSQHWLVGTFEATCPGHNATLKTLYGTTKKLWVHVDIEYEDVKEWVSLPLDVCNLELQGSFFKSP